MDEFRVMIADLMRRYGSSQVQFRIRKNAFQRFDLGRQASASYTPDPKDVVDIVRAGQPCPADNYKYTLPVDQQ